MLTRRAISDHLAELGLRPGDRLLVHSSYRSLGPVEGGPEAVLDAMLDAVGPAGLLAMPAFNYQAPEPCFDPALTPGRTGILAECLRGRPGAVRSLHPTHSVVMMGREAASFTAGHHQSGAATLGSPLDRLAQAGGRILLLGVTHTANTTIHVAEQHAGARKFPPWDEPPVASVKMPDGTLFPVTLDCSSSCSFAYNAIDYFMRRRGRIRDFLLGSALGTLMSGLDVIAATREALLEKPDILLCTRPECRRCCRSRAFLAQGRA